MAVPPQKPSDSDCCGSGCNPCVFDVYEKQLKLWEANSSEFLQPIFNQLKYKPFLLTKIDDVTEDTKLFTFQSLDDDLKPLTDRIIVKMGDYAILKGSEKLSRPYTIINNDELLKGCFQTIIKLYENGTMSNYLKCVKVGETMHWRGLFNHFTYKVTTHIVLIGAGTGIIPLYNIAREIVLNENCDTWVNAIGCFKDINSILLRDSFYDLTSYWNFKITYYLADNIAMPKVNENVVCQKLDAKLLSDFVINFKGKDVLYVICGPESFNLFCKETLLTNGVLSNCIAIL